MFQICDHVGIREEREDYENFVLPWNKTWSLNINILRACFPYEHNYAEAIQNEFVTVFKWLKVVHNSKSPQITHKSPLPCDLLIKVTINAVIIFLVFINYPFQVREFLFEMSDDPFEVKLRDNFELLLDEYNENLKRHKMLRDKVSKVSKLFSVIFCCCARARLRLLKTLKSSENCSPSTFQSI